MQYHDGVFLMGFLSKAREIQAIKNSKPFTDVSNSEEQ